MTDDIDRLARAVHAIDVADDRLARAKRRLRTIAIVCTVLLAVAVYVGFMLASAYNYDIQNYDQFGSGRSRSGRVHRGTRDLHYWLEANIADGVVIAVLVALFMLAMACFVALPLLLLRWQRAKDTHAAAIARAEASVD